MEMASGPMGLLSVWLLNVSCHHPSGSPSCRVQAAAWPKDSGGAVLCALAVAVWWTQWLGVAWCK